MKLFTHTIINYTPTSCLASYPVSFPDSATENETRPAESITWLASFPGSPEREMYTRVQLQYRVPERRSLGTRLAHSVSLGNRKRVTKNVIIVNDRGEAREQHGSWKRRSCCAVQERLGYAGESYLQP